MEREMRRSFFIQNRQERLFFSFLFFGFSLKIAFKQRQNEVRKWANQPTEKTASGKGNTDAKALRWEKVQPVKGIEETCSGCNETRTTGNTRSLSSRMTKYFVIQTKMFLTLKYSEGKGELLINMLRQKINCN